MADQRIATHRCDDGRTWPALTARLAFYGSVLVRSRIRLVALASGISANIWSVSELYLCSGIFVEPIVVSRCLFQDETEMHMSCLKLVLWSRCEYDAFGQIYDRPACSVLARIIGHFACTRDTKSKVSFRNLSVGFSTEVS